MKSVAEALQLYREGRTREAELLCTSLLERNREHAPALELLSDIQLSSARPAAAAASLEQLLRLRPRDAAAHRRLGGALLSLGRSEAAAAVLRRAVDLEPGNVRGRNNLGQAMLQLGSVADALEQFERALRLDPGYAIGHNNRGLALCTAGDLSAAVAAFERSLQIDPALQVARVNLAISYEKLGLLTQALAAYEAVLSMMPRHVGSLAGRGVLLAKLNLPGAALASFEAALALRPADSMLLAQKASALLSLERHEEALQTARASLALRPDYAEALNIEAGALCKLHRPIEAAVPIRRALELDPGYVDGWCTQAVINQNLGDDLSSVTAYRRASALDAGCVAARMGLLSGLIPSVPWCSSEDAQSRSAFDAELAAHERWLRDRELSAADAWTMCRQPLFYLSYQEESNREFLERHRQPGATRLARALPTLRHRPHLRDPARRIRIGIVSAHIFEHSVYHAILRGWLQRLDRSEFELSVFSVGFKQDAVTRGVQTSVEHFDAGMQGPAAWAKTIIQRELDAIIFPEVGMDPTTLALAHLRMAPRQCAAWGHPDTTGLSTIDYYLSAEAFEPPEADRYYSERLVRLPNLGVFYEPLDIQPGPIDLADFGVAAGPVFVCAGTPFKYRPQDDALLVDIARRLRRCTFVFFEHDKRDFTRKLRARLTQVFAEAGLDADAHLVWLPWLPKPAFLGVLNQADVYLDTVGFSGFNTFMQAVEAGLPAVSHEGRFMRGRLGSGILRRLGLTELVATHRQQYVDIAVALGADAGLRNSIRRRLRESAHLAFADAGAAEALAALMRSAAQ